MKFTTPKPMFGRRPVQDAVPVPLLLPARARRTAQLAEAADVLNVIPAPGEAIHAIMTGRYDLMDLLVALIGKIGPCAEMRIATLSFNSRNLAEMARLMDSGAIAKMTLLCSSFFKDHNKQVWAETLDQFRCRGQRAAAARSHCKIVTLACADGRRYALEGSANLRTNSNREQFCLVHDASLHDWHAQWIDELIARHEGDPAP
jgi:hypothetical protein